MKKQKGKPPALDEMQVREIFDSTRWLKDGRNALGLQRELSIQYGVSQATISNILNLRGDFYKSIFNKMTEELKIVDNHIPCTCLACQHVSRMFKLLSKKRINSLISEAIDIEKLEAITKANENSSITQVEDIEKVTISETI